MGTDTSLRNVLSTETPGGLPARGPVDDWSTLREKLTDQERVADVTPDGAVLWLMLDGASGRRIIENQPRTYIRITARTRISTPQPDVKASDKGICRYAEGYGLVLRSPRVTTDDITTAHPKQTSIGPGSLGYADLSQGTHLGFLSL